MRIFPDWMIGNYFIVNKVTYSQSNADALAKHIINLRGIEDTIAELLNTLQISPSLTLCRKIENKVELARELAKILNISSTPCELTNIVKDMMINIASMNEKAIDKKIELEAILSEEQNHMLTLSLATLPNIYSLASSLGSELQQTGNFTPEQIDPVLKRFSGILYSEESNSLAVNMLNGMRNHYTDILSRNQQLEQSELENSEALQKIQHELNDLKNQNSELQDQNMSLTQEISNLNENINMVISGELTENNEMLKTINNELRTSVSNLSGQNKQLREQLAEMNAKEEAQNSSSHSFGFLSSFRK